MKCRLLCVLILLMSLTAIKAGRFTDLTWSSISISNFTSQDRYLFNSQVYSDLYPVATAYIPTAGDTIGSTVVPPVSPGKNQVVLFSLAIRQDLDVKLALTDTRGSISAANYYTLQFSANISSKSSAMRCLVNENCTPLVIAKGVQPTSGYYASVSASPSEFDAHFYIYVNYKTGRLVVGRGALPSIEMSKLLLKDMTIDSLLYDDINLEELIFEYRESEPKMFPAIVDVGFSCGVDHGITTFSSVTIIPDARTLYMNSLRFLVPTQNLTSGLKQFESYGTTWSSPRDYNGLDAIINHPNMTLRSTQIVNQIRFLQDRSECFTLYVYLMNIYHRIVRFKIDVFSILCSLSFHQRVRRICSHRFTRRILLFRDRQGFSGMYYVRLP